MSNRQILISVPHPARDLEGCALIAHHLLRRYGHQSILCDVDSLEQRILNDHPDVIVFDFLGWDSRVKEALLARSLQIKTVLLPIAGLYETGEDFAREAGKLTNGANIVDRYLSWGEFGRSAVVGDGLINDRQAFVTGCPRFDFYREPYSSLIQSRQEFVEMIGIHQTKAPIVLWTTNTPHSSHNAQNAAHRAKHSKLSEEEANEYIREDQTQSAAHSRVLTYLADRHPEWEFVIKVHPLESEGPYLELARPRTNVQVAKRGVIRNFLYHADVIMQRGCTTATEAWMFEKPVLELAIGGYQREWAPEIFAQGNQRVTDLEETESAIRGYLAGAPIPEAQREARAAFVRQFYYRLDGRSSERCAAHIHELAISRTESERVRSRAAAAVVLRERETCANMRFMHRAKRRLGIDPNTSLRFWKTRHCSSRLWNPSEVSELFRQFDALNVAPAMHMAAANRD